MLARTPSMAQAAPQDARAHPTSTAMTSSQPRTSRSDATSALDANGFRALGHRVIDLLAQHLERCERGEGPVLPAVELAREIELHARDLGAHPAGIETLPALLEQVLAHSNHLHHPGYVGHQVAVVHPAAALCELTAALLNNGMAVVEMGPAATAIERALVRWLANALALPATSDGLLTSGGSLGNLTALLAARQLRAGWDVWNEGAHAGPPLCVLVSEQAHYSIARAAQILGWGREGAWPVAVDANYRMRSDALESALSAARASGRKPIAIVGSACTTATGSFDPLERIAEVCAREKLWFHVDGAHGAPAALSERHRHLVRGIERADSVVVDAHKLLHVPALSTAVLFRDPAHACAAFAQEASYLFNGAHDSALRTVECTKRMLGLSLYALLRLEGRQSLAAHVERLFELARDFARRVRERGDFELAVEPEANIVCFRVLRKGARGTDEELDTLHARLREQIVAERRFYIVQTRLHGRLWLRVTLMNPRTTLADLERLLERLTELAQAAS